jgi:hypothetical protein
MKLASTQEQEAACLTPLAVSVSASEKWMPFRIAARTPFSELQFCLVHFDRIQTGQIFLQGFF